LRLHGAQPRKMIKYDIKTSSFINLSESSNGEEFLKKFFNQVDTKKHKYLAFNDEYPHLNEGNYKKNSGTAHAKGVVVTDKNGKGFYLQHSVPKYPEYNQKTGFNFVTPELSHYGQNFLCIAINNVTELNKLRQMFDYTRASIYINTYENNNNEISQIKHRNTSRFL